MNFNYKKYFKDKRVTVMGLGLLGRGVGDTIFLSECGAEIIVTDLKNKKELTSSILKLKRFKNIKFVLGEHRLEDFRNRDFILESAGVPLNSPYIAEAKKHGVPVEMSASLFARLSGAPIIGITGTRGKSTVAHLIFHILKSAGKRVVLGGNILGISNLPFLKIANNLDYAVLELDSWQLQGFGELKLSPHISVLTTFYPDHMNYYGNKMKKYFSDKALIFSNQKKGDILVAGKQTLPYIKRWGGRLKGKVIIPATENFSTQLLGAHNNYNVELAVTTARFIGISNQDIKRALKSFKGIPYRLELVRNLRGIKFYNDTTATTPEATIAALRALKPQKVILIMGGSDKGLDMENLASELKKMNGEIVFLKGTGTKRFRKKYPLSKITQHEFDSINKAVNYAFGRARKKEVIILSPAFASFGMFKNEYDRGEQFNSIVKKLK